jgi:hypothetical protein
MPLDAIAEPDNEAAATQLQRSELDAIVRAMLSQISPISREVLVLHYFAGCSSRNDRSVCKEGRVRPLVDTLRSPDPCHTADVCSAAWQGRYAGSKSKTRITATTLPLLAFSSTVSLPQVQMSPCWTVNVLPSCVTSKEPWEHSQTMGFCLVFLEWPPGW